MKVVAAIIIVITRNTEEADVAGDVKQSPFQIIKSEVMSITHPRSVQKVQTDGRPLSNDAVRRVLCYLGAYVIIVLASILLISLDGKDMTTNLTAVMATFNNIGPGLNLVGPTSNFGDYSVFSKIVLMFDMLVGRLEIFPMLLLFAPSQWKK